MLKSKKYCGYPHSHKKNHSKPGKLKNSEVITLSLISLIWHLQVIELHPLLFVDFSALKRLREILLLCSGCSLPGVSCAQWGTNWNRHKFCSESTLFMCVICFLVMEISLSVLFVFLKSCSIVQNVASLEPVASGEKKKKLFRDMRSECKRLWYCFDGLQILRQNFSEWKSTCIVLGKEGKISNKENFNLEGMSKNQQRLKKIFRDNEGTAPKQNSWMWDLLKHGKILCEMTAKIKRKKNHTLFWWKQTKQEKIKFINKWVFGI